MAVTGMSILGDLNKQRTPYSSPIAPPTGGGYVSALGKSFGAPQQMDQSVTMGANAPMNFATTPGNPLYTGGVKMEDTPTGPLPSGVTFQPTSGGTAGGQPVGSKKPFISDPATTYNLSDSTQGDWDTPDNGQIVPDDYGDNEAGDYWDWLSGDPYGVNGGPYNDPVYNPDVTGLPKGSTGSGPGLAFDPVTGKPLNPSGGTGGTGGGYNPDTGKFSPEPPTTGPTGNYDKNGKPIPTGQDTPPKKPYGSDPYTSPTGDQPPSNIGANPQPTKTNPDPYKDLLPTNTGTQQPTQRPTSGGQNEQHSSSSYMYKSPMQTFAADQAKNYAPGLGREQLQGLKFTDLLEKLQGDIPYKDMIDREAAPDQQYGKQQALEAANEANALLAQGLNRRHDDIAGNLGARGMGEGGAAARLGDLATSETLGQQSANIRQAIEDAYKYGDQRSLDVFGKQIGQRGQDVTQQGQLNNAILELLGQGVTQRGQDVGMANAINQGGLELNQQGVAQRGQDVDQQKTVASIINSLLGQDKSESWQNSSGSSSPGGGGYGGNSSTGYQFNDMLFNLFGNEMNPMVY